MKTPIICSFDRYVAQCFRIIWRNRSVRTNNPETSENLTPRMRNLVSLLWSEWKDLEQQIVGMNEEIEQIALSDPACQRRRQIPGIGPLVATAIVAATGDIYAGLWYPIGIAVMTVIIGLIFLKDTKGVDITSSSGVSIQHA